jgi:uncharacterized glyoxalase superfamily protein PhnB
MMVESVDRAVEFYKDILGFQMVDSVPKGDDSGLLQFAILVKDGLTLMMQDRENMISEYPVLKTEKVQPSITLYISVENLSELFEELKGKCEVLSEIHKTFYGADEFAIRDVDGYVLTFSEAK